MKKIVLSFSVLLICLISILLSSCSIINGDYNQMYIGEKSDDEKIIVVDSNEYVFTRKYTENDVYLFSDDTFKMIYVKEDKDCPKLIVPFFSSFANFSPKKGIVIYDNNIYELKKGN